MPGVGGSRAGFTLIEVMVAVAVVGLMIAGGFKLVTVSLRTLAEVSLEYELINEARKVYLDYMTREDMPNRGERDGVQWSAETDSIPTVGDMYLTFRRLTVEFQDREIVLYLPE